MIDDDQLENVSSQIYGINFTNETYLQKMHTMSVNRFGNSE